MLMQRFFTTLRCAMTALTGLTVIPSTNAITNNYHTFLRPTFRDMTLRHSLGWDNRRRTFQSISSPAFACREQIAKVFLSGLIDSHSLLCTCSGGVEWTQQNIYIVLSVAWSPILHPCLKSESFVAGCSRINLLTHDGATKSIGEFILLVSMVMCWYYK